MKEIDKEPTPRAGKTAPLHIQSENEDDLEPPLPVQPPPPPPSSDSSHTSEEDNQEVVEQQPREQDVSSSSYKIIEAFKNSVDSRIDTLNQQFEGLNNEMSSIQTTVNKDIKMRSLEWAMENVTNYGVFKYRHATIEPNTIYESADLVRSVLLWFRKGFGTPIDNDIYISDKRWEQPQEGEKELFRDKLSEQIYQLTGQKPRLVKKNGTFIIHYS